ncbi:MAG: energy transducer TonB [Ferruginibacter sp.]
MKPDTILKADLLDIIFENKNKDYGAYSLRKHYHERLYKALGIIFLGTMILGLIGFFYKNKAVVKPIIPEIIFCPFVIPQDLPKDPEQPSLKQTHTTQPASVAQPAFTTPVIVDHEPANSDIFKDADPTVATSPEGTGASSGNGTAGNNVSTSVLPTSTGSEPPKAIDKAIPVPADIMPSFPGGLEALKKFLKKNLVTPGEFDRKETVSVKVQFIVGYDGALKGFRVIEDGGAAFNDEVIRVLKKMPAWIPGKAHGENVSVYYIIPVMFTSEE